MDATDLLRKDHGGVNRLFGEFEPNAAEQRHPLIQRGIRGMKLAAKKVA